MQGIFLSFLYRKIARVSMFMDIGSVHQEFSYTLTFFVSSQRSLARLREVDETSGYVYISWVLESEQQEIQQY